MAHLSLLFQLLIGLLSKLFIYNGPAVSNFRDVSPTRLGVFYLGEHSSRRLQLSSSALLPLESPLFNVSSFLLALRSMGALYSPPTVHWKAECYC
jgi:hypothetical protein